jgi:hypothetical protein
MLNSDPDAVIFGGKELAEMIRGSPSYKGGPVRLFVCNPGGINDAAILEASQVLEADVYAPQDYVWVDDDGGFTVGPVHGLDIGGWRMFFWDR